MRDNTAAGTGIPGLDDVLRGGWPLGHLYLVLGHPGTGKTTLGLQFLLEGVRRREPVLFVTLSETAEEVREMAGAHGWSLEGIEIYDLSAAHEVLGLAEEPTMFDPSDIEFRQTSRSILAEIDRVKPKRVVFDSLSELSLLSRDPLAFRREVLLLKQRLAKQKSTTLLLSDRTTPDTDRQLQSLAHGVITIEELAPEFGAERRRLRVTKLRATDYRGGYHDCRIAAGGLIVYPRLVASEHREPHAKDPVSTGIEALDELLGGGLDRGAATLILGPSGSGKSSLISHLAEASIRSDGRAAIFLFDESVASYVHRSESIGVPMRPHLQSGQLRLRQVDPAEVSPGQFAHLIREAVESDGARFVGIDSLNGYLHAMAEEKMVILQLHELCSYLNAKGVMTALVLTQHGLVNATDSPIDITYVADTVMLTRFFEHAGRIRRAISIMKRRRGANQNSIREFKITTAGIEVGEPLHAFRGLFTGTPEYLGDQGALMESDGGE